MRRWGIWAAVALLFSAMDAAFGQGFDPTQIQLIRDTARDICDTVKAAEGKKTVVQIEGDVEAKLNGLLGKVVSLGSGGKGSMTQEEFTGLSRDATAEALKGDQACRERVFNKMFEKLSSAPPSERPSVQGRVDSGVNSGREGPIRWQSTFALLASGSGPSSQIGELLFPGVADSMVALKDAYAVSELTGHTQKMVVLIQNQGYFAIDEINPIPKGADVQLVVQLKPPVTPAQFLEEWGKMRADVVYDDNTAFEWTFSDSFIQQQLSRSFPGTVGPRTTPKNPH